MTAVYKYCDSRGVDILNNLEFKITPPNEFNDPFESTPHLICSNPRPIAKSMLNDRATVEGLYRAFLAQQIPIPYRIFRKLTRDYRPLVEKAVSLHVPTGALLFQRQLLDLISKACGVLCLSERRDSILMWGHYCDKHRGIVIGFDAAKLRSKSGTELRSVNYKRNRAKFDVSLKRGDPRIVAGRKQLLFAKNADWSYERELRMVLQLASLARRSLSNGKLGYFLSIPPTAITGVMLGFRCPIDVEHNVRTALKKPGLSHVSLERALLHDSRFELKFEKCDI